MFCRFAVVLSATLLLFLCLAQPVQAEEHDFFTVSGGWSWPVGGAVKNQYQSGPTLAASFRADVTAGYMGGIEFGYSWYSLDTTWLANTNPGSTYSGGDMGMLSITTENDYFFGASSNTMRPFFNLGLGYYRSFIDDAFVTTGSSTEPYDTAVYKGSFFGFHLGIGSVVNRDRFGLRLDVNYQNLFTSGPNLEFFSARAGLIFYLESTSKQSTRTPSAG